MDDVKLGVLGEGRKAAAGGGDAAPRRPLVPSEKGNAAATPSGGRRGELASRFKPAAPAARRCTSPSPARAAAALDGAAPCSRARSADRARSTSPAPSPPHLKPSAAASRSATPTRDAAAEPRGAARTTTAKAPDGLRASSARSASPSPRSDSPVRKIDRLVRGLPSEVARVNKAVQADAAPERKRSPLRRNDVGNQCENARPMDSQAKRVVEQHRWPAMTSGRGSPGLAPASVGPAAGNPAMSVSASNASVPAAHSPVRSMRPPEGAGGKSLTPSNEMAKRAAIRRTRREDPESDASSQASEGSKSACRVRRSISVPILHRSSSPTPAKVVPAAASSASKACQSPSRIRRSASCRSKCASSDVAQPGAAAQPVFNYIVDARKGKKTANQVENVHQLRLLDNRYLQWRFVNAISEATLSFRRNNAEVYNSHLICYICYILYNDISFRWFSRNVFSILHRFAPFD